MMNYSFRYASNPNVAITYSTGELRGHVLVDNLCIPDQINVIYSMFDKFIVGDILEIIVKPSNEN